MTMLNSVDACRLKLEDDCVVVRLRCSSADAAAMLYSELTSQPGNFVTFHGDGAHLSSGADKWSGEQQADVLRTWKQ